MRLDLVALQSDQRLIDRGREGDQRMSGVADPVFVLIQHDGDAAGLSRQFRAGDPVFKATGDPTLAIFEIDRVGT